MKKQVLLVAVVTVCWFVGALAAPAPSQDYDRSQAIPMPMPEYQPPSGPIISDSRLVIYDLNTGQEIEMDRSANNPEESIFTEGSVGDAPFNMTEGFEAGGLINNFTDNVLVNDPSPYPYRVTGKLYMWFPNGAAYVGSASLIDNNHALTAGHCVYSHGDGGWASYVEFVPAYDGGYEPYGSATGDYFLSWTGWTQYEQFEHDMGVIRLDSNIGNTVGWYGFGYNNNNSPFYSFTFHNPSYPAEYPYSGEYMYYRYGSFDDVGTYILYFYSYSYGGQSGSPHVVRYSGNLYDVAVVSHRTWWGNSGNTRITQNKFGHIVDFIGGILQYEPEVSPMAKAEEGQIPEQTGLVSNYPNPFNATTSIAFNLNKGSNIKLNVYNLAGERVAVLADGYYDAGSHTINFNASDMSSGVYFYRLNVGEEIYTKQMTLLK